MISRLIMRIPITCFAHGQRDAQSSKRRPLQSLSRSLPGARTRARKLADPAVGSSFPCCHRRPLRSATSVFNAFHKNSPKSFDALEHLYVGEVATPAAIKGHAFERDMRELGAKFTEAGLFRAECVQRDAECAAKISIA